VPSDQEVLARLAGGELRELLDLLGSSDVEELELEISGTRLSLRRAPVQSQVIPLDDQSIAAGSPAAGTSFVVAELVGFFRFPGEPDASAVRAAQPVKSGQILGVIDSLNVPVPVPAPVAGRLLEILVEDGQPVEYGQPLFLIGPADG